MSLRMIAVIARSLAGEAPLRFTGTRYFRYKHAEISAGLVRAAYFGERDRRFRGT